MHRDTIPLPSSATRISYSGRWLLRTPKSLHKRLSERAKAEGVSLNTLAVTLLADIALGFVGKAAPQIPATLAGLPVKSMLGLMVIAIAAAGWPRFFEHQFTTAISGSERLLHLAR